MQSITLNDRVKILKDVVFREVEQEMVLLNLGTGSYYGLDAVGSRMWDLLAEKKNIREVLEIMLQEYEVATEDLQRDILHLLQELKTRGLVEVVPS